MRRRLNGPKLRKLIPCGYCFEEWADCYDHILPVSHGGTNKKSNLYPACRRCNSLVGAHEFKSLDEKRDYIREKLKERNEWHNADEMRRMRGDVSKEEETPEILLVKVPIVLLDKETPKIEQRRDKKVKVKRSYKLKKRAIINIELIRKSGRPCKPRRPSIIVYELIQDELVAMKLFPGRAITTLML